MSESSISRTTVVIIHRNLYREPHKTRIRKHCDRLLYSMRDTGDRITCKQALYLNRKAVRIRLHLSRRSQPILSMSYLLVSVLRLTQAFL